jgi:hypothetical protein
VLVPRLRKGTIQVRLDRCWTEYKRVLEHPEKYGPADTEDATKAVVKCGCREVARVPAIERRHGSRRSDARVR